jgi:hypothetical protein
MQRAIISLKARKYNTFTLIFPSNQYQVKLVSQLLLCYSANVCSHLLITLNRLAKDILVKHQRLNQVAILRAVGG